MSKKQQQRKQASDKLKKLEEENFKIRVAAQKLLRLAEAKTLALCEELKWVREKFGDDPEYTVYRNKHE